MKAKLIRGFFLLSTLIFFTSVLHPIKLTSSMVRYDDKTSTLILECRVFIDDFEASVNEKMNTVMDVSQLSDEDKVTLEVYFESHYIISLNGDKYRLRYEASEVLKSQNILNLKFHLKNFTVRNGDFFLIENNLFLDEFGGLQENIITIIFPPHFAEFNYKTNINNNKFSYSF